MKSFYVCAARSFAKRGFTLIELSIVLVVIGLIVAGITLGTGLINTARVGKMGSDIQKMSTAYNLFRDQYNAFPGDMNNASSFWSNVSEGNGNGLIGVSLSAADEHYYGWTHLANAGLISGTYTAASAAAPGRNVPPAINDGFFGLYSGSIGGTWGGGSGNMLTIAAPRSTGGETFCTYCNAVLAPKDAQALDRKLDDGVANTGKMYGVDGRDASAGTCSAAYNGTAADYLLTGTDKTCQIFYVLGAIK